MRAKRPRWGGPRRRLATRRAGRRDLVFLRPSTAAHGRRPRTPPPSTSSWSSSAGSAGLRTRSTRWRRARQPAPCSLRLARRAAFCSWHMSSACASTSPARPAPLEHRERPRPCGCRRLRIVRDALSVCQPPQRVRGRRLAVPGLLQGQPSQAPRLRPSEPPIGIFAVIDSQARARTPTPHPEDDRPSPTSFLRVSAWMRGRAQRSPQGGRAFRQGRSRVLSVLLGCPRRWVEFLRGLLAQRRHPWRASSQPRALSLPGSSARVCPPVLARASPGLPVAGTRKGLISRRRVRQRAVARARLSSCGWPALGPFPRSPRSSLSPAFGADSPRLPLPAARSANLADASSARSRPIPCSIALRRCLAVRAPGIAVSAAESLPHVRRCRARASVTIAGDFFRMWHKLSGIPCGCTGPVAPRRARRTGNRSKVLNRLERGPRKSTGESRTCCVRRGRVVACSRATNDSASLGLLRANCVGIGTISAKHRTKSLRV